MRCFDAQACATALIGGPVTAAEPVRARGRNASVWRIVGPDGHAYALKRYGAADAADRLGAEGDALRFMRAQGFGAVPEIVAADPDVTALLLRWVEGVSPMPADAAGIDACLDFLARLHACRQAGVGLRPAREACWTGAELLRQVDARLGRIRDAAAREPSLRAFVPDRLEPWRASLPPRIADIATAPAQRSLSPSDFGLHNALRLTDGRLVFLDFEYFGWDDPAKLTADVMLHPGMALDDTLAERFRMGAERLYGADPDFTDRLDTLLPAYALRWALILLNEFLPERWADRRAAGMDGEHAEVKAAQLAKAEAMLMRMAA
ncbi:MAG: aminoglycoside phosphotransferase family protein [Alphaproteobacteria bacterium]